MTLIEKGILVGGLALFLLVVAFREKKPSPLYMFALFLGGVGLASNTGFFPPATQAPYCWGLAAFLGLAGVYLHWR